VKGQPWPLEPNLVHPRDATVSRLFPVWMFWSEFAGFVPFGLGTCLCLRFWTGWSISRCVAMAILVGASASLVIELLQVCLPTRDSSLADLVTNILGTAIGAGAAVIGK
jgi:VanZ family protein